MCICENNDPAICKALRYGLDAGNAHGPKCECSCHSDAHGRQAVETSDTPKFIMFSHSFVFLPDDYPACDCPVGYIVLRDNTVETICTYGHMANWERFEDTDFARLVATNLSDKYRVSLRVESEVFKTISGLTKRAADGALPSKCQRCIAGDASLADCCGCPEPPRR